MKVQYNITFKNIPDKQGDLRLDSSIIRQFFFVEDLENMFMTSQLEIFDRNGIFEFLPLTGQEIVEVELIQETESSNIHIQKMLEFDIFNVKTEYTKNGTIYTFFLVERGFFDFIGKQFSKSFKQKKISEIVDNVFTHQLKFKENKIEYNIEETADKIDFVIPYWKPTTTLTYLSHIARRNSSPQEGGFVFYSSLGGVKEKKTIKNFTSLLSLIKQKANTDSKEIYYLGNNDKAATYINNILESRNISLINNGVLRSGIAGKSFYGVNLHGNKEIIIKKKGITEFTKNSTFLGSQLNFPPTIENKNSDIKFRGYFNTNLFEADIDYSFRMDFENINKREIYCKGTLDRYSGKLITIAESSGSKKEIMNELYSGTWLIKNIIHYWNGSVFEQKMTIIKDGFFVLKKELDNFIKAQNKNV